MIGIFDSGLGGISILKELLTILPKQNYIYVADQAHLPYSNKSKMYIFDRARIISQYLIEQGSTTVVIACNTATVSSINKLRKLFPTTKFVGTEPAIKPIALLAGSKQALVLATDHTLQSRQLKRLCDLYAPHTKIKLQSMPHWVALVESGYIKGKNVESQVKKDIESSDIDSASVIVLACTHYIFLKAMIEKIIPGVKILEPSHAIAKQVKRVHTSSSTPNPSISIITTKNAKNLISALPRLLSVSTKIKSIQI